LVFTLTCLVVNLRPPSLVHCCCTTSIAWLCEPLPISSFIFIGARSYHSTMRRFGRAISQQQQHGLVRPPTKPFPPALLASAAELANHHLVDPSSAHSTSTAAITALVAKSPPLDHPEASNVANRHNMLGGTSLQAAPASSASGFTTDDPLTAEVPSNCALLPVPQVSERGESLQQKAMQSANRRPKEFNNAQDGIVVGDRIFATMKWHEHGSPRSAGLRKRQRL